MADVVRAGVIGCGGIARGHIQGILACESAELVATADVRADQARDYADQFGAERWYGSVEELLADDEVDAVHVCVPNALHHPVCVAAARAGKHVLVEKPMALSAAGCEEMCRAAETAGVVLMSGQILRFWPANREAKRLIREGRIGRVVNVVRRRMSHFLPDRVSPWYADTATNGNVSIYGTGSHEVDVVLWILETTARRVFAAGREASPAWACPVEVNSTMELADGSIFNYVQSLHTRQGAWDCVFIGAEGSMLVRNDAIDINGEAFEVEPPADGMKAQVREFATAILEGREPVASGRNVLETMRALDAIEESVKTGRVVEL